MANEKGTDDSRGLVRRGTRTVGRIFDDTATLGEKARAGATVAAVGAGVAGGGLVLGDVAGNLGILGPLFTSPVTLGAEIGLGAGIGAAGLVYLSGFMSSTDHSRRDYRTERTRGHNWVRRVRTASLVAAGGVGLLAAGVGAVDVSGLAHAGALDTGLFTAAAAIGAGGLAATAAGVVTRAGIDPAARTHRRRAAALAE